MKMESRRRANSGFIYLQVLLITFSSLSAAKPKNLVPSKDILNTQHPYIASIQVNGSHKCNGVIISSTHILTTALCVTLYQNKLSDEKITVVTGTNNLSHGGQVNAIANSFYHENHWADYDINYMVDDIGVIKLAKPLNFTSFQKPIDLATRDIGKNEILKIVGWGNIDSPYNLQEYVVTTLDREVCQKFGPLYFWNVPTFDFCTYRLYSGTTCVGNGGSAVVRDNEVVGILSEGIKCIVGYPDFQANLYQHRQFIADAMKL